MGTPMGTAINLKGSLLVKSKSHITKFLIYARNSGIGG